VFTWTCFSLKQNPEVLLVDDALQRFGDAPGAVAAGHVRYGKGVVSHTGEPPFRVMAFHRIVAFESRVRPAVEKDVMVFGGACAAFFRVSPWSSSSGRESGRSSAARCGSGRAAPFLLGRRQRFPRLLPRLWNSLEHSVMRHVNVPGGGHCQS
jgi:hypothetical protein